MKAKSFHGLSPAQLRVFEQIMAGTYDGGGNTPTIQSMYVKGVFTKHYTTTTHGWEVWYTTKLVIPDVVREEWQQWQKRVEEVVPVGPVQLSMFSGSR